jgi:hypothetical protein
MAQPKSAFQNGVKPIHMVILIGFLLIKFCYGGIDIRQRREASEENQLHDLAISGGQKDTSGVHNGGHAEPELHDDHADEEHGGHGTAYKVFHVEFERVELPFIIALWIFVSSLAKIGKVFFFEKIY